MSNKKISPQKRYTLKNSGDLKRHCQSLKNKGKTVKDVCKGFNFSLSCGHKQELIDILSTMVIKSIIGN